MTGRVFQGEAAVTLSGDSVQVFISVTDSGRSLQNI